MCRTAAQARKGKPIRAGPSPAGLQQWHGGRRTRGKRWATPAAVRRGPDDLPHDATRRALAGADVVVVRPARREGVVRKPTARVSSPATAAPSPLLLPGWLSGGLRSARSRCPTSSRSALARVQQTSAPPSAGEQPGRLARSRGCVCPKRAADSRVADVEIVTASLRRRVRVRRAGTPLRACSTRRSAVPRGSITQHRLGRVPAAKDVSAFRADQGASWRVFRLRRVAPARNAAWQMGLSGTSNRPGPRVGPW